MVDLPTLFPPGESTSFEQGGEAFLEEEGVAFGSLTDCFDYLIAGALAEEGAGQFARRRLGERGQLKLAEPSPERSTERVLQRGHTGVGLGPACQEEQERTFPGERGDLLGQVEGSRVGPVKVLQYQDGGTVRNELRNERTYGTEGDVLQLLGTET
jgi:hypothetical protein